ncbi:LuxR C-terminal-related transcriptional regulator [Oceaniferula spumae]
MNDSLSQTSATLSPQEIEQLQKLWRIAAETKLTDTNSSLKEFTEKLAVLMDAKNVAWLAATSGQTPSDVFFAKIFDGWWCPEVIDFKIPDDVKQVQATFFKLAKKYGPGIDTVTMTQTAGKTRVQLRQDVIPDDEFDDFWKTKYFNVPVLGIKERIHSAYTVTPRAESYFLVDRAVDQPAFTERDRMLMMMVISGAYPLHHKLLLERGLVDPAVSALSPREKEAFTLLCTELTQKEIAAALEVSPSTASQYINSVYRKFRVRGRNGLMACCI